MINQKLLLGLLVMAITITSISSQNAMAVNFVDVPLTGSLNVNDFPYGIECSDDTYVYMTIFNQGALARINKSTLATQVIQDDETNASGEDFYSIARNPNNGDLLINKADKGEVSIFHTTTETWEKHPIIEEIIHASVSYPSTYQGQPNLIKVSGEPTHGDHTYTFGLNSRGEAKFTNGNFWVLLDDVRDFDANAESLGVTDVNFHGIVKIDPTTFSATRIAITGTTMTGLAVDSVDSTILWITSNNDDKLFKFDTTTETVVDTISLPAGSKARGLVTDSSSVYIALNKAGGLGDTSKILKVDKTVTSTQTVIDTGASNTDVGTFALMRVGNWLGWSDESGHVGLINLTTLAVIKVNTTDITSNRFACTPDNGVTVWFAGHGSEKATILSIPSATSASNGHKGGDDIFKSAPTFGISLETDEQFVYDGFGYDVGNGMKRQTINDNFWTHFPKIEIPTGEQVTFYAKGLFLNDLFIQEFCFGVPETGKGQNAESCVEIHYDMGFENNKEITKINVVQKSQVISVSEDDIHVEHVMEKCNPTDLKKSCDMTTLSVKFLEPLKNNVAMIKGIDHLRLYTQTYLNDGFHVSGKQFTDLPSVMIPSPEKYGGLIKVTQSEKYSDIWIADDGKLFERNNFGSFKWINQEFPSEQNPRMSDSMYKWTQKSATDCNMKDGYCYGKSFDSSKLQKSDKGFFAHDLSKPDHREQTLRTLGWLN